MKRAKIGAQSPNQPVGLPVVTKFNTAGEATGLYGAAARRVDSSPVGRVGGEAEIVIDLPSITVAVAEGIRAGTGPGAARVQADIKTRPIVLWRRRGGQRRSCQ